MPRVTTPARTVAPGRRIVAGGGGGGGGAGAGLAQIPLLVGGVN